MGSAIAKLFGVTGVKMSWVTICYEGSNASSCISYSALVFVIVLSVAVYFFYRAKKSEKQN